MDIKREGHIKDTQHDVGHFDIVLELAGYMQNNVRHYCGDDGEDS